MKTLHHRPLGFGESLRTLYMYAHRANGNKLWFQLIDSEPHELRPSLTGYLKAIEFPKVERRGKECCKLNITISAHRPVVIECGHDSTFGKGFLLAIASLTPAQLQQPITLEAQPGTQDESVLFCNLWLGSKQVFLQWDDSTDWRAVAKQAMANVKAAQGERV